MGAKSDRGRIFQHLRILRQSTYLIYFLGQLLSMTGTWIQVTVQGWLVYRLSHSASWLGIIGFASQAPAFFLSPLAGVIADRVNRRHLLLWTQGIAMLQAFALAYLAITHRISLLWILALSIVVGVTNAFDMTTRHAFAADMVERKDLPSAIVVNSITFNGTRVIGPALAGVLIYFIGEGWCFFLNGLSYLAILFSLYIIRPRRPKPVLANSGLVEHFREALRYFGQKREIAMLTGVAAFVSLFGFPYVIFLPVIAKDVLMGDAHTYGWLSSVTGIGAILGGLNSRLDNEFASTRSRVLFSVACLGVSLIALGSSRVFGLTLVVLMLTGFFMMNVFPTVNSSIQSMVDDSMRGRILSLYTMSFQGCVPLGSLIGGWLAKYIGTPHTLQLFGLLCVAFGVFLNFHFKKSKAALA